MKLQLRDYLTLGMALVAILLCGYGIGFLLGEKKGKQQAASIEISTPAAGDEKDPWVQHTLTKFDQKLQFTPDQRSEATAEIKKTYDEIRKSRMNALRQYSTHIADLHARLLPHLDESQKKIVEEQRKNLKETLDLGFQ